MTNTIVLIEYKSTCCIIDYQPNIQAPYSICRDTGQATSDHIARLLIWIWPIQRNRITVLKQIPLVNVIGVLQYRKLFFRIHTQTLPCGEIDLNVVTGRGRSKFLKLFPTPIALCWNKNIFKSMVSKSKIIEKNL